MRFILHEIRLWFKAEGIEPKSYEFLPDKINVITGNSSTGKTSFWSIIDYCLLSPKVKIANNIIDKVLWFGIRFTINDKEISIVRKTPINGAVSSEVFFDYGSLPDNPAGNTLIAELMTLLDNEFGITDALRFPYGKEMGETSFNLSYRHFLLFNSVTESVISTPETYFDTIFYGKDNFDKALSHIFELVIGVNNMESLKAMERIKEIDTELKRIRAQERGNQNDIKNKEKEVFRLIDKCKKYKLIEYYEPIINVNEALTIIETVISNIRKTAENGKLFIEIDELYKKIDELQIQLNSINQYKKEYDIYKKNLSKCADSLQPIEFLNNYLSDQLIESYRTKAFIESLELSLKNIKSNLSRKIVEPIKIAGDVTELQKQIKEINSKISPLIELKNNYKTEGEKFIIVGEIKFALEQLFRRNSQKPIDIVKLNSLNEERTRLEKVPTDNSQIRYLMKNQLDESIQRNYNLLTSLPEYKNHLTSFNENEMILNLFPRGQMFPLDNVGSKSNYMFMHLCVYLGLHEHMINIQQEHVPQFLFIDQPSIPYYSGDNNDDDKKLTDAFCLLNSFINYIKIHKKNHFQIFMVEHAPKGYWIDNNLTNFHTVDEFTDGKGLIPTEIYNL